jgi:hypothetical protein
MADGEDEGPVLFKSSRANRKLRTRPSSADVADASETSAQDESTGNVEKVSQAKSDAQINDADGEGAFAKKSKTKLLSFEDEKDSVRTQPRRDFPSTDFYRNFLVISLIYLPSPDASRICCNSSRLYS